MNTFKCHCGNRLFFLNSFCMQCARDLGYFPELFRMGALDSAGDGLWREAGDAGATLYRKCNNYANEDVCNWMVPAAENQAFCKACRLNAVIPDLDRPKHREYWYKIESAKRYLLYTLYQLRLPVIGRSEDPNQGLAFRFLADAEPSGGSMDGMEGHASILTGHHNGQITINLAEADDVERTKMREQMQERYRTLLGHFRHEIGHYYWDRLVRPQPRQLEKFRKVFGDERQNYQAALDRHYQNGPPQDWQEHYISTYASMHPWEDWAESWAHYLHMVSTLETAHDFGLAQAGAPGTGGPGVGADFNPALEDFAQLMDRWVELTVSMNAINRSMGLPDPFPFVIQGSAQDKLEVIHDLIAERAITDSESAQS